MKNDKIAVIAAARPNPSTRKQVSCPAGRTEDQHVRRALGFPVPGSVSGVHVDGRLVGAEHRLVRECGPHRVVKPAACSFSSGRALARSTKPAETGIPGSIAIRWAAHSAGTFRTRSAAPPRVDPWAVGDGSWVHARRDAGGGHLPAARARQRRQLPMNAEPAAW